jgi:hypothetical protein
MNQPPHSQITPYPITPASLNTLQTRFALQVTARLTAHSEGMSADITERLRFAREKALLHAQAARSQPQPSWVGVTSNGVALLGNGGTQWWIKLASVIPMVALVGGLFFIQSWHERMQVSAAAEVDAALLSDDLPPLAYEDQGFAEFLRIPSSE